LGVVLAGSDAASFGTLHFGTLHFGTLHFLGTSH